MGIFIKKYVALYLRITIDRGGRKEGVDAQKRYGLAYAAERWPGWPVEIFSDNNLTAADPDVVRPEFERLRQWVRDGRIEHIWAIEQYRLIRQELEWFKFAAELDEAGIAEIHTKRDGVIRVDDDVAAIKAVLGAGEVRRVKRRVHDKNRDAAMRGLPPGGKTFGYKRVRTLGGVRTLAFEEEQAEALRWAADMVLNHGWGMHRVAEGIRARGIAGAKRRKVIDEATGEPVIDPLTGEPVTVPTQMAPQQLRRTLMSPTVAGLRVYRGEVVGKGNWPAILSEETHQRLKAHFAAPRTITRSDGKAYPITPIDRTGKSARRYLLTGGVAVCGVCHAPLVASMSQAYGEPAYLCHPTKGGKGCVGIKGSATERFVVDTLFAELAKPGRLEEFFRDDHAARRKELTDELESIDVRRTELAEMWGAKRLTSAQFSVMQSSLDEDEARARAELAATPPPPEGLDAAVLRDPRLWDALELDEQRMLVGLFIETVAIGRGRPGRFDTGRIGIEWRVEE